MTAQRRKAEQAVAEVLAILDAQGFGRLFDAGNDSGSEDEVGTDDCDPDAAERDGDGGNAGVGRREPAREWDARRGDAVSPHTDAALQATMALLAAKDLQASLLRARVVPGLRGGSGACSYTPAARPPRPHPPVPT